MPVQNCQDFHFDFDFDCTAGPGSTPPRDDCGDAEYALRLHFYLNGSSVDVPRQGESGCVESDEAIAWKLQQEWNGEQGAVVDLSSDSDEETIVKLCIICNTRPANKSSLQFSSRPTWCCKTCSREQKTAAVVKSCDICTEELRGIEFAQLQNCDHSFCQTCMQRYVGAELEQGHYPIRCPHGAECREPLTSRECFSFIVTEQDQKRFSQMEVEAGIPLAQRVYCPKASCSTLFVGPDDEDGDGCAVCAACEHVFCIRCKSPWHGGMTCEEHKNDLEDGDTLRLAAQLNWKKCPHCGHMVEKRSGCNTMACRCGGRFCYQCGAQRCNHMHA